MKRKNFILAFVFITLFNTLSAQTTYKLYVAGIQITSDIASDIASASNDITGGVSYDDATNTLTLNNATINAHNRKEAIHNEGIDNLIINLIGINNITSLEKEGIVVGSNTIIKGSGSVVINGRISGVYISPYNSLIIKDQCVVEVNGKIGIDGDTGNKEEVLEIDNATLKVTGNTYGSIIYISELRLKNCLITKPAGAIFNEDKHRVETNDSILIKEQVVIEPKTSSKDVYSIISDKGFYIWNNNGVLMIDFTKPIFEALPILIYTIDGRFVNSIKAKQRTAVPLPVGMYIIKIGDKTEKVIVQ
ncbi:hypothetical protein HW49_08810 [Porphyromonadaceae bacterium COT-184 OH4590]|nr:hypothetical protein HW49_08810 [Porphyromonadaceae bacterium COT-184 OH4590]